MKPRLLDLFCCAGGATRGYQLAGFDVTGVDINPQPNYVGDAFHQADAMTFPLEGFDAIHASPPCQSETSMSNRWRGAGGLADARPDLLRPTWARLKNCGVPVVIENVSGAGTDALPLPWIRLHGAMFGLGVHRPRNFWANLLLLEPSRVARRQDAAAVYGKEDGRRLWTRSDGTELHVANLEEASVAMGIDWMSWDEIREAIPPAYCEYVGQQLLQAISAAA